MRFPTPAIEPQGEVLSAAADHTLSGGHMKAAGPIPSVAPSGIPSAVMVLAKANANPKTADVMRAIVMSFAKVRGRGKGK